MERQAVADSRKITTEGISDCGLASGDLLGSKLSESAQDERYELPEGWVWMPRDPSFTAGVSSGATWTWSGGARCGHRQLAPHRPFLIPVAREPLRGRDSPKRRVAVRIHRIDRLIRSRVHL